MKRVAERLPPQGQAREGTHEEASSLSLASRPGVRGRRHLLSSFRAERVSESRGLAPATRVQRPREQASEGELRQTQGSHSHTNRECERERDGGFVAPTVCR